MVGIELYEITKVYTLVASLASKTFPLLDQKNAVECFTSHTPPPLPSREKTADCSFGKSDTVRAG